MTAEERLAIAEPHPFPPGFDALDLANERLKAYAAENALLRKLLEEHTDWTPGVPVCVRTPSHGNCCTCQECGFDHDNCKCEHNAIVTALSVP